MSHLAQPPRIEPSPGSRWTGGVGGLSAHPWAIRCGFRGGAAAPPIGADAAAALTSEAWRTTVAGMQDAPTDDGSTREQSGRVSDARPMAALDDQLAAAGREFASTGIRK